VGVAIAGGPRAAAIAAREAITRDGRPLVVPDGATAAFLGPLPIEVLAQLRVRDQRSLEELLEVLRRLGLRTVGRFAALEAPDVAARFGALGLQLHRLAHGAESEPPDVGPAPVDLRVSAVIDPPAERVDRAAFVAKSLADTLHAELSSKGLACTRVLVTAETEAGDRIERLWRHEGALSPAAMAQRVRWQLEGWLSTGRSRGRCHGGVQRLELAPDQVVPDDGVQQGFWGGTSEAGERAVRALARVQALVGGDAVRVVEWRGGRAPGEQYRLVPLEGVDLSARARPDDRPWPGRVPAPAPAVVWSASASVEVVDAEGRRVGVSGRGLISAPPSRCRLDGGASSEWTEVRAWAGPWCIDERWWDALAHRRRARLQVVLAPGDQGARTSSRGHPSEGSAHLLTLEDGRWWVEATYD
jgi:protein ImuB